MVEELFYFRWNAYFRIWRCYQVHERGLRVKTSGWNGKNQHIELAKSISYITTDGEIQNCDHDAIGNQAIAFVGTSGVQMGWLASQADMLAEDWVFAKNK